MTYSESVKKAVYKFKELHNDEWKAINRRAVAKYYEKNKEQRKEYYKLYHAKKKAEQSGASVSVC